MNLQNEKRLTKQTKDLEELPTPVKTVFEQLGGCQIFKKVLNIALTPFD